jgi:hypothetical protein
LQARQILVFLVLSISAAIFRRQPNWWVEAAIKGTINANEEITFYVKAGDYIARISLFIAALLVLQLITFGVMKKKVQVK